MNDIDEKLLKYLKDNPKIIKESLDNSFRWYDYIKILEVSIDSDYEKFDVAVETYEGGRCSTWLPMPKKFLRKLKLNHLYQK